MLDKEIIEDLADFLKVPYQEAYNRVSEYTTSMLKPEWEKHGMEIYQTSDIYLYNLAKWNSGEVFKKRVELFHNLKTTRVLDFGGGIGSLAIQLARQKCEVFYYDLPGRLRDFAMFRAQKHNLKIVFIDDLSTWKEQFDVVIAIDVLEHVKDLDTAIKLISDSIVDGGALCHVDNFGPQDIYPMHFDYSNLLPKLFEKHDLTAVGNIWAAKNAYFPACLHANQPSYGMGGLWCGTRSTKSEDPVVAYQDKMLDTPEGREKLHKEFLKDAKKNKWDIVLGIPIYNDIHVNLTLALCEMWLPEHHWLIEPSGLVEVSRNRIVSKALESSKPWTHLWFIDSDTIPPSPHALYRMLLRDKDILLGLYSFKQTPARWMIRKDYVFKKDDKLTVNDSRWLPICDPREPFKIFPKYKDKVIPVTGGGAGCMLIKREVFEKVPQPWFKVDIAEGTLDHTGEDIYFLEKCAQYGVQPYLDTSVICLHMDGRTSYPVASELKIKE